MTVKHEKASCFFIHFWGHLAPVYNMKMKKDKRVKQAEEMLDILEENNSQSSSGLIGGFITICIAMSIGTSLIQQMKQQMNI